MCFDDFVDQGQTQSGSFHFVGQISRSNPVEFIEYQFLFFGGNAGSVVFDFHKTLPFDGPGFNFNYFRLVFLFFVIVDEVDHGIAGGFPVAANVWHFGGWGEIQLKAFLPQVEFIGVEHFLCDGIEITGAE